MKIEVKTKEKRRVIGREKIRKELERSEFRRVSFEATARSAGSTLIHLRAAV